MDDDDARVLATAALVALAGGVIAFFALTDRGRRALRQVSPALHNVTDALDEVRTIVQNLDRVAQEGTAMIADLRDAMPSMRKDD
ncbi:MAG: hypothetical protein O2930_00005 [Acidobacteria bacterium]|nr:hypothetical protein [Acidobacteriota bacterium]